MVSFDNLVNLGCVLSVGAASIKVKVIKNCGFCKSDGSVSCSLHNEFMHDVLYIL